MNKHDVEFVRFDRHQAPALHELPSHRERRRGPVHAPLLPPIGRALRRIALVLACLVALLVGALVLLLRDGVLERTAEDTLRRMVPETMVAMLGDTRVRLHWPPNLAVTYSDVALTEADTGARLVEADRLAVAIDPFSLLTRSPRIGGIELGGLVAQVPALRAALGVDGGPVEPVRLSDIPDHFDRLFALLRGWGATHLHGQPGGLRLDLADARLMLGAPDDAAEPLIVESLSGRASGGAAELAGDMRLGGAPVTLRAELAVPAGADAGEPARLVVGVDGVRLPFRRLPTLFSDDMSDHEPGAEQPPVPMRAVLQMTHRGEGDAGNTLRLALEPRDLAFKLSADDLVPFSGRVLFDYGFNDDVVTMQRDDWRLGRSTMQVSARIRDAGRPFEDWPGRGALPFMPVEFDLIANRGRLAPADSPEPPVRYAARAQGFFDPARQFLDFTNIEMHSEAGGAVAEGDVALGEDTPIAVFQVEVTDMTIAGVKQFWPAPVARAARRWVLSNLAGGRVVSGTFDIAEPLRRRIPGTDERLRGDTIVDLQVEGVRFDVAGDLPPVRDAVGRVMFIDQTAQIALRSGTVYLPSGRTATASDGLLVINPEDETGLVRADLDMHVRGKADAIGEIIAFRPINAKQYRDYDEADLSGDVDAHITMDFALNGGPGGPPPDWNVDLTITDGASAAPFEGRQLADLDGTIAVDPSRAVMDLTGMIDGLPARIDMVLPFGDSGVLAERDIALSLDDADRARFAPGLDTLLRGATPVRVEGDGAQMSVEADLTAAELLLPWIGWSKGPGIDASAAFELVMRDGSTTLEDFRLLGQPFSARGRIDVGAAGLTRARFGSLALNPGDDVAVDIRRDGAGYRVDVDGAALDVRALIRHARRQIGAGPDAGGDTVPVTVNAQIARVTGFGGEVLSNVGAELVIAGGGVESLSITGTTASGMPFSIAISGQGAARQVRVEAFDAGELLRFADLYGQVRGGVLNLALAGEADGTLSGPVQLVDFRVFDEPRLSQLANSRPRDGSESLREAVQRDIDTSDVRFEVASGEISLSPSGLTLADGVVRGPLVGFVLRGTVFDQDRNMRLSGTFMPAYGLNSLFADIPLVGLILGNGRERGLIGVTFKLEGPFDAPQVTINPLSIIAPGLFRSIFEFR